jgi:hypothetical protein
MMNTFLRKAGIALALLLSACATEGPRHPQTTEAPKSTVPVEQDPHIVSLYSDPRLDPIRDKVPLLLKPDSIKPSHLVNETKPTPAEKKAIEVWLQVRERAQQHIASQRGEPSMLLTQTRNDITRAIAALHRGDLTYGAFARRVQQIDQDYQTAARQSARQHN